jgi:YVTN family beta-propeller protein
VDAPVPLARDPGRRRFRIAVIAASALVAVAGAVLLATRDSGESVTTRGVTATKTVPGHPGSLAAGKDALWFALVDPKRPVHKQPIYRLELASDSLTRSLDIGGQASYLLHAGDTLYASVEHDGGDGSGPSRLDTFDWSTGDLKFSRPYTGLLGPLARDGKTLWVLQTQPGALIRVDAATLMPTAAPLELPPGRSLGLAVGGGYIWVTAADAGKVLRIEPATGKITPLRVGGFPIGIAVAGGNVWFADRERGSVTRVDPRTLRPIGDPIQVGTEPSSLVVAGGYLFVGRAGFRHRHPDRPAIGGKGRESDPLRAAGRCLRVRAYASGTSVWASSFASNTLTRISSTTGGSPVPATTVSKALLQIPAQGPFPRGAKVTATISVPPLPPGNGGLAIGEGAVWSLNASIARLLRIDPKTNSVVKQIPVGAAGDVAVGDGSVWLTNPEANTVDRIDSHSYKVSATIHVGTHPLGIVVTPRAVWVANDGLATPDIPSVSRIDPARNKVVATIPLGPTSACCALHMDVSVARGAVWVVVPQANMVVRIDPATNEKTAFKLDYPPCAYLDADTSTLWTSGQPIAEATDGRISCEVGWFGVPSALGVGVAFPGRSFRLRPVARWSIARELGIALSVGSVGDAYDNAMAEAFVATLKRELVNHHLRGRAFASFEDAEQHVLRWIAFYNHERLHGELDYQTPASVETQRPHGPPEAGQPALHSGALAGLG